MCRVCGGPLPARHRSLCSRECKTVSETLRTAARYAADRENWIRRAAESKARNRESARASGRRYAAANRETIAEYGKKYRAANRQRYTLHARAWYAANLGRARELGRINASARRARIRGNGVYQVTERDLRRALHRAAGQCTYCHKRIAGDLQWDHVVPIVRGGVHSIGNIVPTCANCNRRKQGRLLVDFRTKVL